MGKIRLEDFTEETNFKRIAINKYENTGEIELDGVTLGFELVGSTFWNLGVKLSFKEAKELAEKLTEVVNSKGRTDTVYVGDD